MRPACAMKSGRTSPQTKLHTSRALHHTNLCEELVRDQPTKSNQPGQSETMAFNVSIAVAYVVLFGVLLIFTLLSAASANWSFTKHVLSFLSLSSPPYAGEEMAAKDPTDHFLSARNSAGPFAIGMSFFASGMGAWVRTTALCCVSLDSCGLVGGEEPRWRHADTSDVLLLCSS
jgi:hypothetical protein